MERIYITSDWHFMHQRDFLYGPRGFDSVEDMNDAIIYRHNQIVTPEDTVYCLGDYMLNDNVRGLECIRELNGQIKIILGNHCTDVRVELYKTLPNVEVLGLSARLRYGKYHFYLSHYPTLTGNFDRMDPLKKQILNLCGHRHTADRFYDWELGPIYHCEVDAHDLKPVLIDDIIYEMQTKQKGWL